MVARVVRIENKKLPMKDATKGMQVIGLGDGAVTQLPSNPRRTRPVNLSVRRPSLWSRSFGPQNFVRPLLVASPSISKLDAS